MKHINFKRVTNFTGRNGYFKQSGIDFLPIPQRNSIMIAPLTSKGEIGRCDMEIPKESIDELIKVLQFLK
jgi:hypothetical protein